MDVGCLSVSQVDVAGRPKSFSRLSQSLVGRTHRHFRLCLVMGGGVAGCDFWSASGRLDVLSEGLRGRVLPFCQSVASDCAS